MRSQADREERKRWFRQLKETTACADCDTHYPFYVMDFDHLPGYEKKRAIAHLFWGNIDILKAELAKCDLLCANCHRIRTYKRRHANSEYAKNFIATRLSTKSNRSVLSDDLIASFQYDPKRTTHYDAAVPGFGIRIGRFRRTFVLVNSGGNRKTLGRFPRISTEVARRMAEDLLREISSTNVSAKKSKHPERQTFSL